MDVLGVGRGENCLAPGLWLIVLNCLCPLGHMRGMPVNFRPWFLP